MGSCPGTGSNAELVLKTQMLNYTVIVSTWIHCYILNISLELVIVLLHSKQTTERTFELM